MNLALEYSYSSTSAAATRSEQTVVFPSLEELRHKPNMHFSTMPCPVFLLPSPLHMQTLCSHCQLSLGPSVTNTLAAEQASWRRGPVSQIPNHPLHEFMDLNTSPMLKRIKLYTSSLAFFPVNVLLGFLLTLLGPESHSVSSGAVLGIIWSSNPINQVTEHFSVHLISHFSINAIIFPVHINTIKLLLYEYQENSSQYKRYIKDILKWTKMCFGQNKDHRETDTEWILYRKLTWQ